jgi:transcription initiation factor TFIIIB Brf1 subunit/transcription initiation factor TFIIB
MEYDKYYNFTDDQLDNLIFGVDLDNNDKVENKESKNKKSICISCSGENLVKNNDKGFLVCDDCGVINEEFLDKNVEFKTDQSNSSRYGCPSNPMYPKSALGTKINARGYNRVALLQKQGQMPYKEKALLEALERIQVKCKKYLITQTVIDSAKILYKKISDCKHKKGKRKDKNIIMRCINRRAMIAACVFYACQLQKEPRSPKEIADIYDLHLKHVNRGLRKFVDYIDLSSIFYEIKSSQSSDFIKRFAEKLNIDKKYIDIAKDVSNNIHKLGLASTHEPPSVAAGCILLVAVMYHIDINKKQISEIFGISDVTISKTYRKIFPFHKIITNNEAVKEIVDRMNNIEKKSLTLSEESLVSTEKTEDTDSDSDYDSESDTDLVI